MNPQNRSARNATFAHILLAVGLFVGGSVTSVIAQEPARTSAWRSDQTVLFKGRLVGVYFSGPANNGEYRMQAQFIVQEMYGQYGVAGREGSLIGLATNKLLPLGNADANHVELIRDALPDGVRVGSEVIVEGEWKGMRKRVNSMVQYTPRNEMEVLRRHRDDIRAQLESERTQLAEREKEFAELKERIDTFTDALEHESDDNERRRIYQRLERDKSRVQFMNNDITNLKKRVQSNTDLLKRIDERGRNLDR